MELFDLYGQTFLGRDHHLVKKNNQDAYCIVQEDEFIVAIVTDGCGGKGSPHSEVGAVIGGQLTAETIARNLRFTLSKRQDLSQVLRIGSFWERIRQDILAKLRSWALDIGGNLHEVLRNNFYFTIVGTVITKQDSIFFTIGDGIIIVNGEIIQIGPFPNNEPPYLAYALIDPFTIIVKHDTSFTFHRSIKTSSLSSFIIGSDGVGKLIVAAEKKIPGKNELVGDISQFWTEGKYFTNPFSAEHRLNLINQDQRYINWEGKKVDHYSGLLPDDTSFIVGRSKGAFP